MSFATPSISLPAQRHHSATKSGIPVFSGVLTGAFLVLSLPKPDLYPLAWIALVPLLVVIGKTTSVAQTVVSSYVSGVIFFAGTCYWITETMTIYGGLSLLSAIGVGALFSLTFAFYFVLFGLGVHLAVHKFGTGGLLLAPPLWVTMEWL